MKLGVLFSGGKDSTFAAYIAKKEGYELTCLISIFSSNPDSYMFHTPSISKVIKQAEVMEIPIIVKETKGEEEKELDDLEEAIKEAVEKFQIEGVITGAVESVYQDSRVQKICSKLGIECFNPLWQKDQFELLNDLIENKFEVIITGVAAYPLDEDWLGRKIDRVFISNMEELNSKFKINPAGEGGEFESLVLNCPLFKRKLNIISKEVISIGDNHRLEVDVE